MKRNALKTIILCALLILLLVQCAFLFSACFGYTSDEKVDINPETVTSVQIYDFHMYESYPTPSDVFFGENPLTPDYILSQEEIVPFLTDLSEIPFKKYHFVFSIAAVDPSFRFISDYVIRIDYSDGSSQFRSEMEYSPVYDSERHIISSDRYYCDDETWENFIKKYLPAQES